jgi:hyperosmotically inducible protein
MKNNWMKLTGSLLLAGSLAMANTATVPKVDLENKVRHELLMLPYFNVFEELAYTVDNGVVTLTGQVTWPVTARNAGKAVERLAGVEKVVNNIEVLPLSSFDNRVRVATFNAIYGFAPLQRYGWGTQPSIRILVKNGNVTLAGAVRSETDRNLAFLRANAIPGVFSVTNEIRVERD